MSKNIFELVDNKSLLVNQMEEPFAPSDDFSNASGDRCGLPPVKTYLTIINKKKREAAKAEYDRKKAAWDACRAEKKEERQERKEDRKEKREDRKEKRAEKREQGKGLGAKIKRFNPLSTAARAGVLAAFRLNMFAMATRMYPAFLTTEEAKSKKIKLTSVAKAKSAWNELSVFWEKKMGGKANSLKSVIIQGHNKPIFKTSKHKDLLKAQSGVDGGGFWDYLSNNFEDVTLSGMNGEEPEFLENLSMFAGKYFPDKSKSSNIFGQGNCAPGYCQLPSGVCLPAGHRFCKGGQSISAPRQWAPAKAGNKNSRSQSSMYRYGRDMVHGADGIELNRDYEFYYGVIDPGTATVIAAGIPVIIFITQAILKKVDKNPYESGTDAPYADDLENAENSGDMDVPEGDSNALKKIIDAGQEDAAEGGDDSGGDSDKIWGMPKPVVYVGGVLILGLAVWGIYKLATKGKGK